MTLRERLLALLREPNYSPANETELLRQLGLEKKRRASLAHELRLLISRGEAVRSPDDRIRLPKSASQRETRTETKDARKFFTPTRRSATAMPAPAPITDTPAKHPRRVDVEEPRSTSSVSLGHGELIGRIQFRAGGSAFVLPEDPATGITSPGEPSIQVFPEDTNVALPGDRVVVRIFPGRKGKRPGERIGGVDRVLERARDTMVGDLRRNGRNFAVIPDDPRFVYEIHVADPAKSGLKPAPQPGDKVVVKLHEWKRRNDALTGEITARLGRTHEPRAELLGIFEKYNLVTEFPADVEQEAAALPDRVHARDIGHRLDYREKAVFTIDPDDAKDFDDALSYEPLESGEVRIGIHIADVSTYVKASTALDREAQRRGNSTYLVGVVIPMLPEKLSNGLCSLVEAQDRLCKAVFLTFAKNGKPRETTFANTVIRSRKRLTYKQAYALLFENDLNRIRALPLPPKHQTGSTGRALSSLDDTELGELQSWVRALWKIASRLRKDRMAHGSLDLDMPETKIFVDEKGYADRLEKIQHDESHQLIEEFMLAANEAVARLTRTHTLPSLYRVHDEPDAEKLDEYRQLLGTFGIHTGDLSKREEITKLLKTLETHPQGYTLRTQLQLEKGGVSRNCGRPFRIAQKRLHPFHVADSTLRGSGRASRFRFVPGEASGPSVEPQSARLQPGADRESRRTPESDRNRQRGSGARKRQDQAARVLRTRAGEKTEEPIRRRDHGRPPEWILHRADRIDDVRFCLGHLSERRRVYAQQRRHRLGRSQIQATFRNQRPAGRRRGARRSFQTADRLRCRVNLRPHESVATYGGRGLM